MAPARKTPAFSDCKKGTNEQDDSPIKKKNGNEGTKKGSDCNFQAI
jgi:hypothetical protein